MIYLQLLETLNPKDKNFTWLYNVGTCHLCATVCVCACACVNFRITYTHSMYCCYLWVLCYDVRLKWDRCTSVENKIFGQNGYKHSQINMYGSTHHISSAYISTPIRTRSHTVHAYCLCIHCSAVSRKAKLY